MNRLASSSQLRASFLRWALFAVPLVVLLGTLSGVVSGSSAESEWFRHLVKPDTFPPPATFGIVWTVLYALMGLAVAMVCAAWGARRRGLAITVFVLQLMVNLAWSPVFFAAHQIRAALLVIAALDVLVLLTIVLFWKVRRATALLLLPYIAWIGFATYLNWQFLKLNPRADSTEVTNAVQRFEL
jgi:benzodiazapine receptor